MAGGGPIDVRGAATFKIFDLAAVSHAKTRPDVTGIMIVDRGDVVG